MRARIVPAGWRQAAKWLLRRRRTIHYKETRALAATRWGILGLGSIANAFAEGLTSVPDAQLMAVGSRSQEKAEAFRQKHGALRAHGSYEALAADPDVDIIYVATPHPMHAEDAMLCLNHGKAVLCEKPFTVNAKQAEQVIALAREKNLFLLEGMWSRFFPLMAQLRTMLKDGVIGDARMLQSDFGFRADVNPQGRLFAPELAGGALLDVGCYVVSLASMLFGTPTAIAGVATLGETGVDEQAAMTLRYDGGEVAALTTAIRTNTEQAAVITGTTGRITIHSPWWKPDKMTIVRSGQSDEVVSVPFKGNGFNYEAIEAAACLTGGKMESDILPLDESLSIMRTLDTLREQFGVKYPME